MVILGPECHVQYHGQDACPALLMRNTAQVEPSHQTLTKTKKFCRAVCPRMILTMARNEIHGHVCVVGEEREGVSKVCDWGNEIGCHYSLVQAAAPPDPHNTHNTHSRAARNPKTAPYTGTRLKSWGEFCTVCFARHLQSACVLHRAFSFCLIFLTTPLSRDGSVASRHQLISRSVHTSGVTD